MKKRIAVITLVILFFTPFFVFADDIEEEALDEKEVQEILQASVEVTDEPSINSRAAIVLDRNSDTILFEKNSNEKRAMASTTKIMTAIIVLENSNLTDVVEVSKKSAGTGGSRLGLHAGDKITMNDLLYGLLLKSRQ